MNRSSDDPVREIVLYDESSSQVDRFPSRVTLSPNLRFWGTINYDETTERLSPRVLDRTGMISLQVTPTLNRSSTRNRPACQEWPRATYSRSFSVRPKNAQKIGGKSSHKSSTFSVMPMLRSVRVLNSAALRRAIKRYLANSAARSPPARRSILWSSSEFSRSSAAGERSSWLG